MPSSRVCIIQLVANFENDTFLNLATVHQRGEERFREEGEMAQKVGGGGRKDAKK